MWSPVRRARVNLFQTIFAIATFRLQNLSHKKRSKYVIATRLFIEHLSVLYTKKRKIRHDAAVGSGYARLNCLHFYDRSQKMSETSINITI